MPGASSDDIVIIGRLGTSFGVQGWLKATSFTNPATNLLTYDNLLFFHAGHWQSFEVEGKKQQGKDLLFKLKVATDREVARQYTNADIGIHKDQLPATEQDEYYWRDLEGMEVINHKGISFGKIDHLFNTGSNDVMTVMGDKLRYVPYLEHVVLKVDPTLKQITVEWDEDF